MPKYNANNERVKRQYFTFLQEAKGQNEATIDAVAQALARFESDTDFRDFKAFHVGAAMAFKRRLSSQVSSTTGSPLSKSTVYATLAHLKRFFEWLSDKPGYRSRLEYSDAQYFNLSEKEGRIATARRERPSPTMEQLRHILASIPAATELDRRNRALIAFMILTGARDGAIASLKLKHIDLDAGSVYQDAREVKTKFSKTFVTYFLPVGADVRAAFDDWVRYLRAVKLWGNEQPLFPATAIEQGDDRQFQATGVHPVHWRGAGSIRAIFSAACSRASLAPFHAHSVRHAVVLFAQQLCQTPEELKAMSQNLGHEDVMTTLRSYGHVSSSRQAELIRRLGTPSARETLNAEQIAEAVASLLKRVS